MENQSNSLREYFGQKRALVDKALEAYFPASEGPASAVISAMKYSLLAGGKRIRPILCIGGAEAIGGKVSDVLPVACALELIHTYSLIHDDLPFMDDDDLRRGKPTNHKVFGEAVALLAGDGLLTEAFKLMASAAFTERVSPPLLLSAIRLIAHAAGYEGMVGGQTVDIQSEKETVDVSMVEFIHRRKTGALIAAAVCSGALLGGANKTQLQAMDTYGRGIGLAFQISDDILNVEGDSQSLGKSVGSDERKRKVTYPAVVGLEKSKEIQTHLVESAIESLGVFDYRADPLRQIARYIIDRED
jgi:geranylgeranyl diphosphate synthase type II